MPAQIGQQQQQQGMPPAPLGAGGTPMLFPGARPFQPMQPGGMMAPMQQPPTSPMQMQQPVPGAVQLGLTSPNVGPTLPAPSVSGMPQLPMVSIGLTPQQAMAQLHQARGCSGSATGSVDTATATAAAAASRSPRSRPAASHADVHSRAERTHTATAA